MKYRIAKLNENGTFTILPGGEFETIEGALARQSLALIRVADDGQWTITLVGARPKVGEDATYFTHSYRDEI